MLLSQKGQITENLTQSLVGTFGLKWAMTLGFTEEKFGDLTQRL